MKVRLNYMDPIMEDAASEQDVQPDVSSEGAPPIPAISKTQELDAHPMSVSEAAMQMDLMHNDFLVFVNAETNEVNVLYKRKDNGLGLIETHAIHS